MGFDILHKLKLHSHWQLWRYSKHWLKPLIVSLAIFFSHIILSLTTTVATSNIYQHGLKIVLITVITWMATAAIKMIKELVINRTSQIHGNHIDARRINTKIDLLAKIIIKFIILIGFGSFLATFSAIKELGISILASASMVSVIMGFAAQKSLSNIMSGIHIAFTQPLKIGDEVLIENEGGLVEEINLTYVVICSFDKRRLIIPINYFIEKSFQNWTRNSLDLVGTLYLELDYTAPVEQIRQHLDVVLNATPLWDKKTQSLQISALKAQTIELRILASAATPGDAWNLKCHLREALLTFLQEHYPQCLPKTRLEVSMVEAQK